MSEILPVTRFGNPVLREHCRDLSDTEILDQSTQDLITSMRYTLEQERLGVGIAAPQIGQAIALSVIGIKPTQNRPELEPFNSVIINPILTNQVGRKVLLWEGCVSTGKGDDTLFAQVPRFEAVTLTWKDEHAIEKTKQFSGFLAQVFQHEVDHLNGILFLDRVTDMTTVMLSDEYRKRILNR